MFQIKHLIEISSDTNTFHCMKLFLCFTVWTGTQQHSEQEAFLQNTKFFLHKGQHRDSSPFLLKTGTSSHVLLALIISIWHQQLSQSLDSQLQKMCISTCATAEKDAGNIRKKDQFYNVFLFLRSVLLEQNFRLDSSTLMCC